MSQLRPALEIAVHGCISLPTKNLVVQERQTSDQGLAGVGDNVVTDKFPEGKHSESPIVDLIGFAFEGSFLVHFNGKWSVVSSHWSRDGVVDGTDGKESGNPELYNEKKQKMLEGDARTITKKQRDPSSSYLSRDNVDGINAVWDIGKLEARSKLTRETVELRDNVSDDSKHGSTSIFAFPNTGLVKLFLVLVRGQVEGVPVTNGGSGTWSRLVRVEGGGSSLLSSWGKGTNERKGKGKGGKKLHNGIECRRKFIDLIVSRNCETFVDGRKTITRKRPPIRPTEEEEKRFDATLKRSKNRSFRRNYY